MNMASIRYSRAVVVLLLCCTALTLTVLAHAQMPYPTFKAKVEAVTVPVIVTDSSGTPVRGLKAADFSILEQGKQQRVALVEEVRTKPELASAARNAGIYTNRLGADSEQPRVSVILLDLLNANFADQNQARRQLAKFLSQWEPGEPMALVVFSCRGLLVAHDFTRDPNVLMTALKSIEPSASYNAANDSPTAPRPTLPALTVAEAQAMAAFDQAMNQAFVNAACGDRVHTLTLTMTSLQHIAHSLSGLPGRKSLIWLTAGLPLPSTPEALGKIARAASDTKSGKGGRLDWRTEIVRAYQAVASANVSIYPIDVKGLVAFVPLDRNPLNPGADDFRSSFDNDRISDLKDAADITGGKAFYRSNDLAAGLRNAVQDSEHYYLLTYYRDTSDNRPGWRGLKVKVSQPGANVRARTGFVVSKPPDPATLRSADLSLAAYAPLDATGIPLDAQLTVSPDQTRVEFTVFVPAAAVSVDETNANHINVDWLVAVLKNGQPIATQGNTVEKHASSAELTEFRNRGLSYQSFVSVRPGDGYSLRFIARDGISGRMGTLTVPLAPTK